MFEEHLRFGGIDVKLLACSTQRGAIFVMECNTNCVPPGRNINQRGHMKQRQSKNSNSKTNQLVVRLLSILLRRLESLGLYLNSKIRTSLGRRSSVVGSHLVWSHNAGSSHSIALGLITMAMAISLVAGFCFGGSNVFAAQGTISMSVSSNISLNLPATEAGIFASSSTESNDITISTDNITGYTLGIVASTEGSNALTYTSGGNVVGTIPSITSAVSASNYADNTYASTNNLNNTWGYRPSKLNSSSNSNYLPAPTSASTVTILDETSGANSVANNYNLAIGARVNLTTTPGSYTNTFVVTAVANPVPIMVSYNANGGSGTITAQTVDEGNSVTIADNGFTRTNYYFMGYATSAGGSVAYRPGQVITPSSDLNLYAVWGNSTTTTLYNAVASLNHGRTLDNTATNGTGLSAKAGIKASTITKDNSGVFTYNPTTFGTASDADNTKTIYLYRGILDSNLNSSGNTQYSSYGNSANYPNYVKLGNTCWRIVRTTGSGGVKMIYNGLYSGGTTNNSCANATTNAQVITSTFNNSSASNGYTSLGYKNIHAVGYTYNSAVNGVTSASANTTIAKVFGTSTNNGYDVNSSDSIIKQYIEKTWFNNISAYENILEVNAGYCNDRSLYSNGSYALTNKLAETEQIVPYGTSSMTIYYFGAYTRNADSAQSPTLGCPRGVVDLYSTTTTSGGNGQLTKPVALLTADEMSFAGSGNSASNGSAYNISSYLQSGSSFWLLSPNNRDINGYAYGCTLFSNTMYPSGRLSSSSVNGTSGVRPAISLAPGITIASGSGTATNPWVPNTTPNYTLNYDANNGTGAPGAQVAWDSGGSYNFTVSSVEPTRDGYTFLGWSTSSSATTASYTAGNTFTATSATSTLYAVWQVPKTYMQDLTLAQCQVNVGIGSNPAGVGDEITVYDRRTANYGSGDDGAYTVRYINGECWMTQNLRITGTISATDSNYTGNDYNISANDLATNGTSGGNCYSTTGYTNPCTKNSNSTTTGVWYNYCAATVGTICTSSTSTVATEDVCPANWHLPSGPSTTSDTDFNKLVGNTTSGWQDPTDGLTAFGAVSGGYYYNGSLDGTGYGYWWSATANYGTNRYRLGYNSSSGRFYGNSGLNRNFGYFVRCVRSS